jgi:isopropylmalate/homocitrate/citramalate synthase
MADPSMRLKDVTLREAAQMPGRSYTADQRVEAGRALDELGVAYLQAGFPATGPPDGEVLRRLAATTGATVSAIARPLEGDVDAALAADAGVVDLFVPLSERQLTHSLGKPREAVLDMLVAARDQVVQAGAVPHVSVVDAFRTEREHLLALFERFPESPNVTLADTVGCRTPPEVRSTLEGLGEHVDLSRVGVHFHDDIGTATANALAAHAAGVGFADVSVAGLGERAGNPPIEELVVAGALARDTAFGTDPAALVPACRAVLEALGETVPPGKAVLGEAVTTHESGIHTEAMLAEPSTFEPFDPARFGGQRTLLFGAGTGRSGAATLLEHAGVDADPAAFLERLRDAGPLDYEEALALARREFG